MIPRARSRIVADSPDLPDVRAAVEVLVRETEIGIVQQSQVNGLTQEITVTKTIRAAIQPFTAQQLIIRPEGERGWRWYTLYASPDLELRLDDVVIVGGVRLRVRERFDYAAYGYVEYHCIEDYDPAERRSVSP